MQSRKRPNAGPLIGLALVAAVVLTACGGAAATAPTAAPAPAATAAPAPAATAAPAPTAAPAAPRPPPHQHPRRLRAAPEATAAPEAGGASDFTGVEINILTFVGPQVAEPLQRRSSDFTALTGAKVNVVTVPNSELYQKALADLAAGTN